MAAPLASLDSIAVSIHSKAGCYPFIPCLFLSYQGPLSLSKEDTLGFCNWREDGEAGERLKEISFCLNKEVKLTGRVSFRNSTLTLKKNQKQVPPLLWTENGRISGALMATHFPTHIQPHTHAVSVHKHLETLVRGSYCATLWQYYV